MRARAAGQFSFQASVPADGYDGDAATIHDCGVAAPGVEGIVASHGANLFVGRSLVYQVIELAPVSTGHLGIAMEA